MKLQLKEEKGNEKELRTTGPKGQRQIRSQ
jgi:hypothetical protein